MHLPQQKWDCPLLVRRRICVVARHEDDRMVEIAQARQVRGDVVVAARPQQCHVGMNAGHAEHGHQQRRLVLAVAVAAGERLARGPRHDRPLAELDARVADLAAHRGQQPLDDLVAIGLFADRLLHDRADGVEIELGLDEVGIVGGDVGPRLTGRENDFGRLHVLGGQIRLGCRCGSQRAEFVNERRAAVALAADRLHFAKESLVLQRQRRRRVDHQPQLADPDQLCVSRKRFDDAMVRRASGPLSFQSLPSPRRRQRSPAAA